jgi:putative spermidine/putrescine transport system permease protein
MSGGRARRDHDVTAEIAAERVAEVQTGEGGGRVARQLITLGLLVPALAVVGVFLLPPLLSVLMGSFTLREQATVAPNLENYRRFVTDPYYWTTLGLTLRISFVSTLCTLLLGYLVAYFLVRMVHSPWLRRLGYLVVIAPLFTSSIVRSFGWMVTLGNNGVVNSGLKDLGLIDRPLRLMYNEVGIVIGLTHILLPFMVLSIAAVLQNIDHSLENAAADLGASRAVAFLTITFPLSLPGVVAGSLIVFTLAMSAYVTPSVLSGGRLKVVPMLIYEQYNIVFDWGFGAAMSGLLLVLTLAIVAGYTRILRAA